MENFRTNWREFWNFRHHRREFIAALIWLLRLPLEPPEGIIPLVDPILRLRPNGGNFEKT